MQDMKFCNKKCSSTSFGLVARVVKTSTSIKNNQIHFLGVFKVAKSGHTNTVMYDLGSTVQHS